MNWNEPAHGDLVPVPDVIELYDSPSRATISYDDIIEYDYQADFSGGSYVQSDSSIVPDAVIGNTARQCQALDGTLYSVYANSYGVFLYTSIDGITIASTTTLATIGTHARITSDTSSNPVVCWEKGGHVWVYDIRSSVPYTTDMGLGREPCIALDPNLNPILAYYSGDHSAYGISHKTYTGYPYPNPWSDWNPVVTPNNASYLLDLVHDTTHLYAIWIENQGSGRVALRYSYDNPGTMPAVPVEPVEPVEPTEPTAPTEPTPPTPTGSTSDGYFAFSSDTTHVPGNEHATLASVSTGDHLAIVPNGGTMDAPAYIYGMGSNDIISITSNADGSRLINTTNDIYPTTSNYAVMDGITGVSELRTFPLPGTFIQNTPCFHYSSFDTLDAATAYNDAQKQYLLDMIQYNLDLAVYTSDHAVWVTAHAAWVVDHAEWVIAYAEYLFDLEAYPAAIDDYYSSKIWAGTYLVTEGIWLTAEYTDTPVIRDVGHTQWSYTTPTYTILPEVPRPVFVLLELLNYISVVLTGSPSITHCLQFSSDGDNWVDFPYGVSFQTIARYVRIRFDVEVTSNFSTPILDYAAFRVMSDIPDWVMDNPDDWIRLTFPT